MEQQQALKLKSLSKSDYVAGMKCPGHLWMIFHDKENIPAHSVGTLKRFDDGKIVGQLAKKLFPQGIDIPEDKKNAEATKELLSKRKILFEAGIPFENVYGRADILVPVEKNEWDIIEVKSSTKVKKEHYWDLSFQKYVYEKAGLKIRKCFLILVNNEYVREGEIDIQKLLYQVDVTEEVEEELKEVPQKIEFLWGIVKSPTFPNTAEKNYCTQPKECQVKEKCWEFLPEHHVFHLYRGRGRKLFDEGIHNLYDVPEGKNEQQKIQLKGEVHVEKAKIQKFLEEIEEPACYLDFETCSLAVPQFEGTKPYQQIPFQFSLHVGKKHFEHLHDGKDDPRPGFLAVLKEKLPNTGSVVVYFEGFEGTILKKLANDFPEYKEWVDSVLGRIVDLHKPFKEFWYYNPAQHGSASIKKVLPALVGKGYEGFAVTDGDCASVAYLDMTFGKMDASAKKKMREELLKYCGRDTEAMVWIVEKLRK